MLIEQSISRVRAYRTSKDWSKAEFAREAGLSANALKDIDRPDWSPTADTLRKIEAVIPPEWQPDEEAA